MMSTDLNNNTKHSLKVAHITLEFKLGVGGIKSVTTGLIPALAGKDIDVSVITPYYDVYNNFYDDNNLTYLDTVSHIYKGKQVQSDIWRACSYVIDGKPVYHYLVKPAFNSNVARLFNIENEKDMYRSFPHSESQNRLEYFNSAVASMVRMPYNNIPEFDIIHGHTWHTGLAGCLVKEFENLPLYQNLIQHANKPLKKIPYVVSTIHMLLKGQHGILYSKESVTNFLQSVGIPLEFATQFPQHSQDINPDHLKQLALTLLYADQSNTVSRGLATEIVQGKAEGLEKLCEYIHSQSRLSGICNGTSFSSWEATNPDNLQEYTFNLNSVRACKQKLKIHLASKYPQLNPNKKWFIFIGRFANEKGIDYLPDLLNTVTKVDGNLIVLGSHVVTMIKNGQAIPRYKEEIDRLKSSGNILIIDDADEQHDFGKQLRAASDCAVSLSKNEACGLVPMELMTCGAISVAPNIQGLPDTVISLRDDPENGTGFLYDGDLDHRAENLDQAIINAVDFLNTKADSGTLNAFMAQLIDKSRKFDWNINPSNEYVMLYTNLLNREVLTFDKVRDVPKLVAPILPTYSAANNNNNGKIKIWQIGFNKAGSTTLFKFFANNKVPSVHYGLKNDPIADVMYDNYINGRPLVSGRFDRFTAYFDMENIYLDPPIYIGLSFFKDLDREYPNSKFILNIRDKDCWIKSRCSHIDVNTKLKYIDVLCQRYNMTEEQVISKWSHEWDEHHKAVLEYFKDRPNDLLVFDIDNDSPDKIRDFFKDYFTLNVSLYEIFNKTEKTKPEHVPG